MAVQLKRDAEARGIRIPRVSSELPRVYVTVSSLV